MSTKVGKIIFVAASSVKNTELGGGGTVSKDFLSRPGFSFLRRGRTGNRVFSLVSWKHRGTQGDNQTHSDMALRPVASSYNYRPDCGSNFKSMKSYALLAAVVLIAGFFASPVAAAESALVSGTEPPVNRDITARPGPAPTTSLCATTSPCKCVFDNGTFIDLSALANSGGTARFEHVLSVKDFNHYYWNPCNSFTVGNPQQNPPSPTDECRDVAACQNWYSFYSDLGYQDAAIKYNEDERGFYIYYKGESDNYARDGRDLFVYLRCDPNVGTAVFEPLGDDVDHKYTYVYEVTHSSLCLNAQAALAASISPGTIMCISALVLITLYLVGGVLIMKFHRKSEGVEVIPNYTLWSAIPGLIKDGALFIREKVSGNKSTAEFDKL